ncbi:MAG: PD40 domain-containing protein [Phycisphaerales bacterium]|nr:PD40 domain-containing protein [Phycisphaerales bacterium]
MKLDVDRRSFYTDDQSIRASAEQAQVRDILWRTPEPLRTVTGDAILGDDPAISPDGDTLLLTRRSDTGDRDLYIAGRVGDSWTEPRPLAELNSIDNELAPAISADGQRLYFASDRPGGQGGLDVWVSIRQDGRWQEPTPLALNSNYDDTDPHPLAGAGGVEAIAFASNRIQPSLDPTDSAPRADFDLYLSDLDSASPRHLAEISSDADDLGPASTPSGDFLYFASKRRTEGESHDLYRSRLRSDPGLVLEPPRTLGPSINTASDELSPALGLEGFAIFFVAETDGQSTLMRAVSREVYLSRVTTRGDLLSLLPWILLALALVLLLALLRRTVRDELWRGRLATLGLMAKCVLASLLVHAGLMALLAAMQVSPDAGQPFGEEEGVRVALSSSSMRSSIADQMRGSSEPAALERASTPDTPAPSVDASASASMNPASFQVERATVSDTTTLSSAQAARESAVRPPAQAIASGASQLPESTELASEAPSLSLPEATAPAPLAQAEAGIDAPARSSNRPTGDAIGRAIAERMAEGAGSPSTVSLAAESTEFGDASAFTPSRAVGDATSLAGSAADTAPSSTALAELPGGSSLAPTLSLPSSAQGDVQSDEQSEEQGTAPLQRAAALASDAPAVSAVGSEPVDVVQLAADSARAGDSSAFSPSASVADSSTVASELQNTTTSTEAFDEALDAPTFAPALALPAADGDTRQFAEQDVNPLQRASDSAAPNQPIASDGIQRIETVQLAADSSVIVDRAFSAGTIARDADPASEGLEPEFELELPTLGLATPQLALPDGATNRYELFGIVIDDQTQAPIEGARVRLDLEGTADLTDRTLADGSFVLGFDQIPENAALTATHEEYMPGAVNIAQRDIDLERRIVVRLRKVDPLVIVMEPEPQVRHLGNDEFSGRINSQFQRRSEGLVLQIPFEMTRAHSALPLRGAELRLFVKGTQAPNPVRINGQQIATLAQSPRDGSFGEQVIRIPSGILQLGENVLELESVARPGSDKDDYEFVNPRVVLLVREPDESTAAVD